MKIKSNELFPSSFNDDFKKIHDPAHEITYFTEGGGRGSCKSTFISLNIVILMLSNPELNCVVLRKTANTLRDSVYSQIKWAIDKLGVAHLWNCTLSPLQMVYKPTGQTIFFRGGDEPDKIKSIKAPRGYTGILWIEELAEFSRPSDVLNIQLSIMRGGSRFWVFQSFNPPSSPRHWTYDLINDKQPDRIGHITNYTMLSELQQLNWLGEAFINEALRLKEKNELAYRNIFLGEAVGVGANIFPNAQLKTITDEEIEQFEFNYEGLDWGFEPDVTAWVRCSLDLEENILYIYDELILGKMRNEQLSEALKKHRELKGYELDYRITADSAEPKSIADFRSYGWNMRGAVKGSGSRETSFKWLQNLEAIIIDPERAPRAAKEFISYEHILDKKTGDILSGYPDGQSDHAIDATRYAIEEVWRRKGN